MKNLQQLSKPDDEIFRLKAEFDKDSRTEKINAGIGIYLDEKGKPFILPVVKKAVKKLEIKNFNYLPLSGDPLYLEESAKIVLGKYLYQETAKKIAKQGTIGGTNALYMWCRLIKAVDNQPVIILSNPTWENHLKMFEYFGFKIIEYPQLKKDRSFNFEGLASTLEKNRSACILFQSGPTHNPTGINPDKSQWQELAKMIKQNKNQVLFDFAYLGLGEGIDSDSFCLRHFIQSKIPTSVAVSYSKNMSLYQHRAGVLMVSSSSIREKELIEKYLQNAFRLVNSNPSAFAEQIVKTILASKQLISEWLIEIRNIRNSLKKRRDMFMQKSSNRFEYLKTNRGLFSLLFLKIDQIHKLRKKYAIYMLKNSRINFGGVAEDKIKYLADAVLDVTT